MPLHHFQSISLDEQRRILLSCTDTICKIIVYTKLCIMYTFQCTVSIWYKVVVLPWSRSQTLLKFLGMRLVLPYLEYSLDCLPLTVPQVNSLAEFIVHTPRIGSTSNIFISYSLIYAGVNSLVGSKTEYNIVGLMCRLRAIVILL